MAIRQRRQKAEGRRHTCETYISINKCVGPHYRLHITRGRTALIVIIFHSLSFSRFSPSLSIVLSTNNSYGTMDCRSVLLFCLAVLLAILVTYSEGRTKKVVIHVPYKVKRIRHTHTVFKTVHHHHTHHDHQDIDSLSPAEEHEHYHYMHLDEPVAKHSHVSGIGVKSIKIPEFLPDAPLELSGDIPDLPRDLTVKPQRLNIPLYKRND